MPLDPYVCLPILHVNMSVENDGTHGGSTRHARFHVHCNPFLCYYYAAIVGSPMRSFRADHHDHSFHADDHDHSSSVASGSVSAHGSASSHSGGPVHATASWSASAHGSVGSVSAGAEHTETHSADGWSDHVGEHASANLAEGAASAHGHAQLDLGGNTDIDAKGSVSAHANLGTVSESAEASVGEHHGQYSGSIGASAQASASAGVSAKGSITADTAFGDIPLASGGASAHVGAHAGASAHASGSIGDQGVSAQWGAHAGAGVSANADGHYSLLDGLISGSAHAGVSAGPEIGTSGGFHATDHDGDISVGVSGDVAAALGLHGGGNININTNGIGQDISNGIAAIGNDISNGIQDVEHDV